MTLRPWGCGGSSPGCLGSKNAETWASPDTGVYGTAAAGYRRCSGSRRRESAATAGGMRAFGSAHAEVLKSISARSGAGSELGERLQLAVGSACARKLAPVVGKYFGHRSGPRDRVWMDSW